MKGVLLPGNRQVVVTTFPEPAAGTGEVVVRIKASAICRSDLSLYYGQAVVERDRAGNFISGHEPAGVVEEVGAGVTSLVRGDRVAIYLAIGCGHCRYCRHGDYHLCPDWECLGFTRDGGNAELLVVPERNCLRLPDGMSFVAGAVSTDAFGTLYSACRKLGAARDKTVAIFGLGPMGSAGVLAAKACGARVVAIDPLPDRRLFAQELGADETIDPEADNVVATVTAETDGEGADIAIDCSGNSKAQNAALDVAKRFGKVAFIGESRETTINPSDQLIRKQLTLIGSWYFNISEWDDIACVITRQNIPLEKLVTHTFSLDEAPTAFRMFDERKTEKAVFLL
jgi:threonine dehydrogenase-like Zn-dependent dehydrogenase